MKKWNFWFTKGAGNGCRVEVPPRQPDRFLISSKASPAKRPNAAPAAPPAWIPSPPSATSSAPAPASVPVHALCREVTTATLDPDAGLIGGNRRTHKVAD